MTNAWTPGPWQMSGLRQRIGDEVFHTVGPDKGWVAAVPYSDKTDAQHLQSLADARLIAAAPDMAEALEQAAEWFEGYELGHKHKGDVVKAKRNGDRAKVCRAALAKARGAP